MIANGKPQSFFLFESHHCKRRHHLISCIIFSGMRISKFLLLCQKSVIYTRPSNHANGSKRRIGDAVCYHRLVSWRRTTRELWRDKTSSFLRKSPLLPLQNRPQFSTKLYTLPSKHEFYLKMLLKTGIAVDTKTLCLLNRTDESRRAGKMTTVRNARVRKFISGTRGGFSSNW